MQIAGCKKLLWHRIRMDVEKMQILPPSKRGDFPFAPPKPNQTKKRENGAAAHCSSGGEGAT